MRFKPKPTPLQKKARRGFRGYPVATVAYYGPDDERATKVAVGIISAEDQDVSVLERWFTNGPDVRTDQGVNREILAFIQRHQARSVVMTDGILGCPHEEGVDYQEGESCRECPFWAEETRSGGTKTAAARKHRPVVAVAWYASQEDWSHIRQVASDPERLENSYEEWLAVVDRSIESLSQSGVQFRRVPLHAAELVAWCAERDMPIDAAARAQFSAERVRLGDWPRSQ